MPNWSALFDGKGKVAKRNAVVIVTLSGLVNLFAPEQVKAAFNAVLAVLGFGI